MKVIKTDNFNRESVSDSLVCEGCSDYWAVEIVKALNEKFGGDNSPNYFQAVTDDHKLYVYDPT